MSSMNSSGGQSHGNLGPSSGMATDTKTPANAGVGEPSTGLFDSKGAIGKQFTEQGAIGGTAQSIGGPFDKDGLIGKQFKDDGAIGGSVQNTLGGQFGKSN